MLFTKKTPRPNVEKIRQIKQILREALDVSDTAIITVNEITCLEEGCPPIETVIAVLQSNSPTLQNKIYKPINDVQAEDLKEVCRKWGFKVPDTIFKIEKKET